LLDELEASEPVPPDELPSSVPVAQAQRKSKKAKDEEREKHMKPMYALGFDAVKHDGSKEGSSGRPTVLTSF